MLGVLPLLWLDLKGNLDLALRPHGLLEQDLLVPLQLCLLSLLLILIMPLSVPLLLFLQLLFEVEYEFIVGLFLILKLSTI